MASFSTLPTSPLPHLAMDYARLRAEGLRLLGELAGDQWTDYNAHDPGVTILEQLCYAITDLAYRADFEIPDLLAGGQYDAHASLPSAATIFASEPVTSADLRKLALDAGGGQNAWIEAQGELECPFYHHAASGELHLRPDPGAVEAGPVGVQGLHRVWLPSGEGSSEATRQQAVARLHASRPLCEDLRVEVLRSEPVWISASIEIAGGDSATQVLAAIVASVEAYLATPVPFETLAEAQARAGVNEDVFCGPGLERGFVADSALAASERRRWVYISDLIHAITDVDAVRAVRRLSMASSAGGELQPWALPISADGVPRLASDSRIVLLREGRPLPLAADALRDALDGDRQQAAAPVLPARERDLARSPGRDRNIGRYYSILNQLPLTYGVGRFGLPASAGASRLAQAKQLQAYLLVFDQLLANAFAQLAHARELFSHFGETPRTYFAQAVNDPAIDLDVLRQGAPADHQRWLDDAVVSTATDELGSLERRNRFLSHLLARYAEQLHEYGADQAETTATQTLASIERKQAFLQDYPRVSASRGTGCDVFARDSVPGLADRLRLELGLSSGELEAEAIVVEHLLLRPIAEDLGQIGDEGEQWVPILSGVEGADPFSSQLSVVVREPAGAELALFEQLVAQLVVQHTPAQLGVTLHWFGDEDAEDGHEGDWSRFVRVHQEFRQALADYRGERLEIGSVTTGAQLRARDTRDRLIEELGLGQTYPLRDLPVPELVVVLADTPAQISISFAQVGVRYRLCDHRSGDPIEGEGEDGQPYEVDGQGGTALLPTPAIVEDISFRILAVKLHEGGEEDGEGAGARAAWLHTKVTVKEGLDTRLDAQILARVLDFRIDNPTSTDARYVDYGDEVEVEVHESQEGVRYEVVVVDYDDPDRDAESLEAISQQEIVGTSGTITLRTVAVHEDIDLRIRGRKQIEGEGHERVALLDLVLPLRVRAKRTIEVVPADALVDFGAQGRVRVRASQRGVAYRVYAKAIADREFHYDDPPSVATIDIDAGYGRVVRVKRPPYQTWWKASALRDYAAVDKWRSGNAQTLSFPIPDMHADEVFIVKASKKHKLGTLDDDSAGSLSAAIQLDQATAMLVRPDPEPALRVRAFVHRDGNTTNAFNVYDGVPGVYYTFEGVEEGQREPARSAYFHQRDDKDATTNKGIGQLRIEVDLALARDRANASVTLAKTAPLNPIINLDPAPLDARWRVIARKAMSGVEEELVGEVHVGAIGVVRAEPASVTSGASATVVIESSEADHRYQLSSGGEALGEPVEGGEGAVELDTGVLSGTKVFWVSITPTATPEPAIVVERLVMVTVEVQAP